METNSLAAKVGKCGVAIFGLLQGRATTFAAYFTIIGTILAFRNQLTMTFVAFIGAIQSLVVLHSVKEDMFQKRDDK